MALPISALHSAAHAPARPLSLRARLLPCTAAALLGLLLLYGVGLAQPHALHEAAHDTRHATGFPCH